MFEIYLHVDNAFTLKIYIYIYIYIIKIMFIKSSLFCPDLTQPINFILEGIPHITEISWQIFDTSF